MIIAVLKKSLAEAELRRLTARLKNTLPFYKTWSTVVVNKARSNARSKGGKTLWKRIEKATQVSSCNASGAKIECFSYIGAHKELGGPIVARNKKFLTIPLVDYAKGKTVEYLHLSGIKLFRPAGRKVLMRQTETGVEAVFALCKKTKPQQRYPWWPEVNWVAEQGVKEAKWHLMKGH